MQVLEKLKMNKKGQTIQLISGTVIAFLVLIFVIFAVLYGVSTLNPASFFTASSAEANATSQLTGNLTTGVASFGARIPTVLTILGVVLALSAIVLLIFFVRRMQGAGGGGGGGL